VCVCVFSLFLIFGHSFERICTKYGLLHPYTLQMVTEVDGVSLQFTINISIEYIYYEERERKERDDK